MLISRFGEIRMKQDDTFDEFHDKLNDIVNLIFNLGERIPKPRILRKLMRSLSERFHPKVTNIKENKDLNKIKIEDLVGFISKRMRFSPINLEKSLTLKTV